MILTAACAAPAAAAEPFFGLQGALSFPANDLSNVANTGIQVGGHARWDFGGGHGIMARADINLFGSKNGVSTTSFGAGADYSYHLDQNRRGVYFLAGVTMTSYSVSYHGSSSRSGLGLDLGVGYDVDRRLGFQARYTTHNLDGATFSALNLGVTYGF
jgi:hypothetical protein